MLVNDFLARPWLASLFKPLFGLAPLLRHRVLQKERLDPALRQLEHRVQRIGQVMGPLVADEVHLVVREGEEHGFDIDIVEEEVLWLAKELQWLEKVWLR